jgi:RNA polymerase-associated protein
MLWRLPSLDIELPGSVKSIYDYKKRIFARDTFKTSLSDLEHELRE